MESAEAIPIQVKENSNRRKLMAITPKAASLPRPEVLDWEGLSLKEAVRRNARDVERQALTDALRMAGGNKAEAARMLQINYKTILSKLRQYGIKFESRNDIEQKR